MTEPTMIERVARAICYAEGYDPDDAWATEVSSPPQDRIPAWKDYTAQARAAITAMSEPTWAQISAGQEVLWKGPATGGPATVQIVTSTFADIYRAMIATAIKEG